MIVVDSSTRQFSIPAAEQIFGVEADAGSEVKYFQAPRYVGNNLDLAGSFLRINYRNANGDKDSYLIQDVTVDGDSIRFSWELTPKVTAYKGEVKYVLCATGPDLKLAWHTTLGSGKVLEGLESDNSHVEEETSDVVAQLIVMVEAQTATVEAAGTAQIDVVRSAAADAEAAAVAEIEAKGVSTLATIPEDYTATVNAVQSAANGIRKKVSGEVIRVDDVSPMEHYPLMKVFGKNLCPVNDIVVSGEHPWANKFIDTTIILNKGKYTISADYVQNGTQTSVCLSVRDATKTSEQIAAKALTEKVGKFTITFEIVETSRAVTVVFYSNLTDTIQTTNCSFTNIQLEEGNVATEYVPYIDPTTVTVRRCGKNIIPYPFYNQNKAENGITFTDNGDGTITVNGTASDNAFFHFAANSALRVKGRYVLSGLSGGSGTTYYIQPFVSGVAVRGLTNVSQAYDFDGILEKITMVVCKGTTLANLNVKLQMEKGDNATAFEMYQGSHLVPSFDGMVSGLTATSPTMTLLTDTPGMNIECEYTQDTNKVIAEILEKITALGG